MKGSAASRDRDTRRRGHGDDAPEADDRRPTDRDSHRDNGNENSSTGHSRSRRLSGSAAVAYAKAHLADLTGQPAEAVSALNRTRDGWRVVIEVLELERIPRTTDILASYCVDLDESGDLMGYERTHRYYRNDVGGDQ